MLQRCCVCGGVPRARGVLCVRCADELGPQEGLLPEHIVGSSSGQQEGALLDRWGRPHRLTARTLIGRSVTGLCILSASISRLHAEMRRESDGWRLRDHGSRNGTFVDGVRLAESGPVRAGQILVFGRVAFWLAAAPLDLPGETVHGSELFTDLASGESGPPPKPRFAEIRLHGPTSSGGGVLEQGGRSIALSHRQYALACALAERWHEEAHQPIAVRGFLTAGELVARLCWDTPDPGDAHLKQLVRRLRRHLSGTGWRIEATHGLGYRLTPD